MNAFLTGIGILISLIYFLAANVSYNPEYCVVYLSIFCIAIVIFCLKDFSHKLAFMIFYLCFFTFLVSGATIPYFRGKAEWKKGFSDSDYIVACNCLMLSSIFMLMGYLIADKARIKYIGKNKGQNILAPLKKIERSTIRLQKISFFIFVTTTLLAALFECRKLLYAMSHGYVSLYTSYSESAWAARFSVASMSSFFLLLSTWPSKKKTFFILILGAICPLMILNEGGRGGIVIHCMFAAFYLYRFNEFNFLRISKKRKRKIFKRYLLVALLAAILVLPWLYDYGYTRVGRVNENSGTVFDGIVDFFDAEGTSFLLVGYASQFKGQLHKACYSLGNIWNVIIGKGYKSQTAEAALLGSSFGDAVTYKLYPEAYLNGYGLGSSYVGEFYYDFGYVGVCIINLFIGIFLRKVTQCERKSILQIAIILNLFYHMLVIPRGSLTSPIGNLISRTNIVVCAVSFYISKQGTSSRVGLSKKGEYVT